MRKIDTHQHLLYRDRFTYEWTADLEPLANKPFRLAEYNEAAAGCEVHGSLFMEVDVPESSMGAEARFFCELAKAPENKILGVIATCRPENPDFSRYLSTIRAPALVGLRRILHTQPDALSQSSLFRNHVDSLAEERLTFDMCVLARQLPLAMALADACRRTQLILDHVGVPEVAAGKLEPWREQLRELSKRPNVACKISGIVAYADPKKLDASVLRPYVEHAIACFGWDRVVWGSDWPVCNLTTTLKRWVDLLEEILANESSTNREKLYEQNARRIYRLRK